MTSKKARLSLWVSLLLAFLIYGTSTADSKVTTPDVLGQTVEQATLLLQKHDLILGSVSEQETHHPSGSILVQAPRAQQLVPKGSPIRLVVAIPRKQPNKTTVPVLEGLSLQAAKTAIQQANLILGSTQKRKKEIEEELVLYQSPPANSQLIVGSKINLVLADPIPLTGPRVKLLLDKRQITIGEEAKFKAKILNPPAGEVPIFSFTIDRKLYKTNIPEFTHKFTATGPHNIIASVRYSRNPWIASLTRTISVSSESPPTTVMGNSTEDPPATTANKSESTELSPQNTLNTDIKVIVEKQHFNVGESTRLSIHLNQDIAPDELKYAFTINGNTHYTKKPEYNLLLSKQGKYIITASARYKREPWVASTAIALNAKLNHTGLADNTSTTSKEKTITGTRIKTVLDKYTYRVGETIDLSIEACNVPLKGKPRYSFTIDRKAHYLTKPNFQHTFTRPGKYIITASIRYGRQAWIPSLSKVVNILPTNSKQINKDLKMPVQYKENYRTVPTLIGLNIKRALSKLRKNGLQGSVVSRKKSGTILSQNPPAYSCAATGTKIKLSTSEKESGQQYAAIHTQAIIKKPVKNQPVKIAKRTPRKKTQVPKVIVASSKKVTNKPIPVIPEKIPNVSENKNISDYLSEEEYISAIASYNAQESKEAEENISELAAIYYSLESAQWYEASVNNNNTVIASLDRQQITENKELEITEKSPQKSPRRNFDNSMDKIYLIASSQHILSGNKIDFTLTRTITEFDSTYHVVFHEDGKIIPADQSRLSYVFNNWGVQSVYAEAETGKGITKSTMIKIWVWPKWSLIALLSTSVILFLFFIFRYLRRK